MELHATRTREGEPSVATNSRRFRWVGQLTGSANLRDASLNAFLTALSGLLTALTFPPTEYWWLAPVCLVPLLLALRRTATIRAAGWLLLLWGLVLCTVALSWLSQIFHLGVIGIFLIVVLPWVLFGLGYRVLYGRLGPLALVLMTPVLWVAVDWIRCEGWYFRFSWLQAGFSQAASPVGSLLYPLVGVYGVTFLLVLVNALLAAPWLASPVPPRRWRLHLATVVVCTAGLLVALWLWHLRARVATPSTQPQVAVVVQAEERSIDELIALTLQHQQAHPALVVWPEYAVQDYPLSEPRLLGQLQEVARTMRATLVVGCKAHAPADARCDLLRRRAMLAMDGALFYNTALILGPDGTVVGTYHKAYPIQLFSDGVPGGRFPVFTTPAGRLGAAICYDFDYATTAWRLTRAGATVLVVPTFDAARWGATQHRQHSRMAQARAAEVGRPVARATSSGISQMIRADGWLLASISNDNTASTVGPIAATSHHTPYVAALFVVPYLCLLISLLAVCWALISRWARRKTPDTTEEQTA